MNESGFKISGLPLTGTTLGNWLYLLWENRLRISPRYTLRALFITLTVVIGAPFRWYEQVRFGAAIRRTRLARPPIFIIGHWRSGTTFLHMLMVQDRQFACASNFQVFMPSVFLGAEPIFKPSVAQIMPARRPMDNFRLDVDGPSEEEFALANMVPYSLYHGLTFPRRLRYYARYCSMREQPERIVRRWQRAYRLYLQKLTYRCGGRQLVLKNPPSTARLKLIMDTWPEARFIHIHRNPVEVFLSTMRMYERMVPLFHLQVPRVSTEEFVLDLYAQMFDSYFRERPLVPAGNLVEIGYEELMRDPIGTMRHVYQALGIAGFGAAEGAMRRYVDSQRCYRPNRHRVDEATRRKVAGRWKACFEAFGYPTA